MRGKYAFALLLLVVLGLGGFIFSQNTSPKGNPSVPETAIVLMKQDLVEPETLTIKNGTTVTFKNEDNVARWPASNLHPTHTIYPEFDPLKPIEPGQSWQFTFDKTGEWKHHDHLLPAIRGKIVVVE